MKIDDETLDKLKKENEVDNSRLEELLNQFFDLPAEGKNEFIELFKQSRLFMPIEMNMEAFDPENLEVGKVSQGPLGFDIKYLENENGKSVPLFTSDKVMEKAGVRVSTYVLYMSDLAEMMKQTDRYASVTINPFTEHGLDIAMETFLGLFKEASGEKKMMADALNQILEVLRKHSIELEENTTLFFRHDENVMVENAVDGVFVPELPFSVSSNPKYGEGLKYTNILLMPKSKRILLANPDDDLDIIIAPGTEFKLEDTLDKTQNLWMCGAQPFYNE
ncbi:MAG: SseB family protein [Methanobrevibacter sp.]|uniref:SseB family protein n=1 Tax=Methanobrevibacter sp. TaxID=66852 RepID=UPI0025D1D73B|nr:SseB family protein [Methanobrevibacter sp.]MBR3112564.1 SseB family protein [Methanobrevibacter sp.]